MQSGGSSSSSSLSSSSSQARGAHAMMGHSARGNKRLVEHLNVIYNNPVRLARERQLADALKSSTVYFVHIHTASVTAARRADNPFSNRNGIVDFTGQL